MTYRELIRKLNDRVGIDTQVSFDDDERPTELRFHRMDRLSEDLIREAVGKVAEEFPGLMGSITGVFVSFEDRLGPTRRRVAL